MLIPKDSQEYLELTEMLVNRSQCQYNILLNISNICMFVKSLRHEVQTFASYVDGYVKVCTSRLISDQIGIRLTCDNVADPLGDEAMLPMTPPPAREPTFLRALGPPLLPSPSQVSPITLNPTIHSHVHVQEQTPESRSPYLEM